MQIFLCTFPYVQGETSDGTFRGYTVFDMLSYLGGEIPDTADGAALQSYVIYFLIFLVIPIIGFLFCLFDRERNVKNIVSIFCCLAGVVSILVIVNYTISLGSVCALLLYLLTSFISIYAIMARLVSDK
jgi:hypothetical protein